MLPTSLELPAVRAALNHSSDPALKNLLAMPLAPDPSAHYSLRVSFDAGRFQVRNNKVRHFVKTLDVALLPARHMRNLSSPRGSLRIFKEDLRARA